MSRPPAGERRHSRRDPIVRGRTAWLAACACLIALIFLSLAWELVLAPLKPGGSWLVLKVLPLSEAAKAHEIVAGREGVGKVVLDPWA